MDDLNFLLHREQLELMRARTSACGCSRMVHSKLAAAYGQRIRDHRLPYRSPSLTGAPYDPSPFGLESVA